MPITRIEGKHGPAWRVRVEAPRDAVTGARRWRSVTVATRREAGTIERELRYLLDHGREIVQSDLTVREFFARQRASATDIRGNTWYRNGQDLRLRILPMLGDNRLADLRPVHMQMFVDGMAADFAPATIRRTYAILHGALDQAVHWRILGENPCSGVALPRAEGAEMRVWSADDVRAFLAATADCPYAALWRLAVLIGLRKGELLAVQWQDMDWDHRALTVRRTRTRDRDLAEIVGAPKTRAGYRTITLPRIVLAALTTLRERDAATNPAAFIFRRPDGRPLETGAPNRMLRRYAKEAHLPVIRFHDLRHTAATLALMQGVSPRVVQERMGHASLAMTLGLYSHVTLTMQDEAADKMDAAFGNG